MRGDLIFLVSLLSIASATILYIGSDNSYKYIYGTSQSLKKHLRDRMREVAPKCCDQLTKECFACATGLLVEDFCKRHSGEYGCPERPANVSTKIMIAIPTFNRRGYTKFNGKVIREYHKIPSNSLYIFDDCSTEYGEKELRKWYGKDIHFFPCRKQLKADANIRRMFEYFVTTDFDLIFSVDTDLIFQKHWREFILKHLNSTDGVMSLYHSNAPHHKSFNCKGDLCEKKSMGSAGTVMKRSIVKKMLKEHKSSTFDWGFVSIFKKRKIRMMVPNNSLIMHYGQIGQNNGCGSSEVAKGFDRTVLPKWVKDGLIFYFDKCSSPSAYLPTL